MGANWPEAKVLRKPVSGDHFTLLYERDTLQIMYLIRCCSESILLKVSEERRDFEKIRSIHFRDIQKSPKSQNFERSCTWAGGEKTG